MYNPTMPVEPVDQYEVKYFIVRDFKVVEESFRYHVSSKWADVYPQGGRGADFTNEWQAFDNGQFHGERLEGWPLKLQQPGRDFVPMRYETRVEALRGLKDKLTASIKSTQARLDDEVSLLEDVSEELAADADDPEGHSCGPQGCDRCTS